MNADAIQQARKAIPRADALLIAAGAGMGVDSGLPDFRGPEGFWRAYPAFERLGLRFEQIANPRWFRDDPHLAWGFYGHRLNLYRATQPHAGFTTLLKWAQAKSDYFVFTSNVDGHFQRIGFPPGNITECHGSIHHLQCVQPCCKEIWFNDQIVNVDESSMRVSDPLPKCPRCHQLARPNVLMFDDEGWSGERSCEQAERYARWMDAVWGNELVILEFGAGTAVPTVRWACESLARAASATLIRVNPREPQVPDGHIAIAMGASEAIRALDA